MGDLHRLEPSAYGTHSMRRTKAALIYRKTGNLRAVQLLLGHTTMDSTVRYLGVELEDALAIAESGPLRTFIDRAANGRSIDECF
jgi:integrase